MKPSLTHAAAAMPATKIQETSVTARHILLDERAQALDAVLDRGARAATGLQALGVREGDCIALLMRNDFAFIEATQAAALVGAYGVPINWHGRPDEVRHILDDAKPRLLIAHADLLRPLQDGLPDGLRVLTVRTPPEVR